MGRQTNVLIVTGPVNSSQLGIPDFPFSEPTRAYHLPSPGIRSYQYHAAMTSWLGGVALRERVKSKVLAPGEVLGRVGLIWFSAGHGAARALHDAQGPEAVDQWLALDGLYGPWTQPVPWALAVAKAAARRRTSLVATASTTTPGSYGDCLTCWKNVAASLGVKPGGSALPAFPDPAVVYRYGACCVMGYPDVGHHAQVPAMRAGMLGAFSRAWAGGGLSSASRWLLNTTRGKLTLALGVLGAGALASRIRRR